MRILLVVTHPSQDSYCYQLFLTAKTALEVAGHDIRTRDLYREGFDPVLTQEEWDLYFDDPALLVEKQSRSVADLRWAEALIFVHPTWYFGVPSVLKGWFERTWLPGVTFEKAQRKGARTKALMHHIKRLCVVTTSGSPWWFLKIAGDPQKSFFTRALRPTFGRHCRVKWFQLHNMNCVSDKDRRAFDEKISRYFRALPVNDG